MTSPTTSRPHTDHLVDAFREHGFVHVPQVFSRDETTRLREAARAAASTDRAKQVDEVGLLSTVDGWEHHDTLRELALHPRLGAIAEDLAGMPLRLWGGEVLVKRAQEDRPTGLHDDETTELLNSRISLNAWIALVDVPVERGCLTFLPGSHRRPEPERIALTGTNLGDLARDDADSYLLNHWPDLRWSPRVTVPLRAGDVTFHHRRTAHAAGANHTDDDRTAMVITYTDANATYQPVAGHDPLPYQPGQALPDERYPRVGHGGNA